jgi:hypothetical protein
MDLIGHEKLGGRNRHIDWPLPNNDKGTHRHIDNMAIE